MNSDPTEQEVIDYDFRMTGMGARPIWRWLTGAAYGFLVASVILSYLGVGDTPWVALEKIDTALDPRVYYYFLNCVVYSYLLYYVYALFQRHQQPHLRFLQPWFSAAFVADGAAWWAWNQGAFVWAAIFTLIAIGVLFYGSHQFYRLCSLRVNLQQIPITSGEPFVDPPNMGIYLSSTAPLATYSGWLAIQFAILLTAAFTEGGTNGFTSGNVTGATVVLLSVAVLMAAWIIVRFDPHVAFAGILATIPLYHAASAVCTNLVQVTAWVNGLFVGLFLLALMLRFHPSCVFRRFVVSDDVMPYSEC